jgi:Sulfotransferase domain
MTDVHASDAAARTARFSEGYEILTENRLLRHKGSITLADRVARLRRQWRYQFLPHYFVDAPGWRLALRRLGGRRVFPNFACVGAIKSGTSDLANQLFLHPCVIPPLTKEFSSVRGDTWLPNYPTRAEFEQVAREHGTALTGYFYPQIHKVQVIDELGRVSPKARIILLLRDPVERAYSHYKWDLFLGGPRVQQSAYFRTFLDNVRIALDLFPSIPMPTICGQPMLATGIYDKSAELWMRKFGRENVLVVKSEDFFRDPASVVGQCFDFLGAPRIEVRPFKVVNPNPLPTPPFDPEARRLLAEFYQPHNERLYALLGRDMGWQKP